MAQRETVVSQRQLLETLDSDHNGRIETEEIRQFVQTQSANGDTITSDVSVTRALTAADGNLELDGHEFGRLMIMDSEQPHRPNSRYRGALYRVADSVTPKNQQEDVHNYLDAYRCCPPPIFIITVTLLEVIVYLYYTLSTSDTPEWFGGCPGCLNENGTAGIFIFAPALREQAWRFASYMLLHAGLEHILGNIIMQLAFGIPLELVHTALRVGPLYMMGVVLGAMCQYTFDPNAWLVGASGGVYAIIVAHLANTIINWAEMPYRWIRLVVIVTFIGFDVGHALYRRFGLSECVSTSYAAHLGGAFTGFLLGIWLLRNLVRSKQEDILRWVCFVLYILIVIALIIMLIIRQVGDKPWLQCQMEQNG